MIRSYSIVSIFLLLLISDVNAVWENAIHKKGIKTVQCYKSGFPLNPPIILLNTDEQVHFSFDDLNEEQSIYYYSVIHCTANWESSNISMQDYLEGFQENELYDYSYSRNTLQDYTHFSLDLPNRDIQFKTSGNYIINVFEGMDQSKPVISQRFMIYENIADVSIRVKSSSVVSERDYKQEIDFTVRTGGLQVYNPYDEIKVVVLQNMRWDNAIYGLQPKFIKGSELIYDFEEKSSFEGGNEYRNFDIKNIRYQSERIAIINDDSSRIRIFLHPDEKRSFKRYSTFEDLNGNYMIKQDYAIDSNTEADYVWVYFTLPFDFPVHEADLYIGGQFSNYHFSKEYRMEYDFDKQAYKKKLLLKQGYYNYAYFYVPKNETAGLITYIEGSHYQTDNDYLVMVYYWDNDKMYDRIIAMDFAISNL